MTCDYEAIRKQNIKEYGEGIGRFGRPLLSDRYAERTHFIFELLQNAEDALARRKKWEGSRAVSFELKKTSLRVSHYGDPFNESDVRGICGIDESTKEFNEIGRFGIGFKSVYAFTEQPEIHSGSEDFAIEEFVRPIAVPPLDCQPDETVIKIPFKDDDDSASGEIAAGLERLGVSSLLFLREIEEIAWNVEGGASGQYLRESKEIDSGVRKVTIIGKQKGESEVDEEWLVFSSPVTTKDGNLTKPVEIAFSYIEDKKEKSRHIRRVERSPLVVFFPTVVETHLGFLIQGPYRTTPSRDNIPRDDEWNRRLVEQTAFLLRDSLCWLRDQGLLDTEALRSLPLDPSKFSDLMFSPLFEDTKDALLSESLLPRFDGGHEKATQVRLGRTQELRELFSATQLATLYGEEQELSWLSGDITQDRTPDLRGYLMQELNINEVDPEDIIRQLDQTFLEEQTDDWIRKLYEFLNAQSAIQRNWWFDDLPLVRLEDGKHVPAKTDDKFLAFLPTEATTGFPTIRKSICTTEPAREFLQSLGLKEPDPVDDVIEYVLPRYKEDEINISDGDYQANIQRILSAFDRASEEQRDRLIEALKTTNFVMAIDAGDDSKWYAQPGEVYLATERLKNLFNGVEDVLFVNDSYTFLHGENIRELLERCDAVRYLRPISDNTLSNEERSKLREESGHPQTSGINDDVTDWTLEGLKELLETLPNLDENRQKEVARLLWSELAHLEERRGKALFNGNYTWSYYGNHQAPPFSAAFMRRLNTTPWVPGVDGKLHRPEFVLFDSLGWNEHPFLESKINFKPPDIEMLAQKAGIDSGVLELIKEHDLSEADLRKLLDKKDESRESEPTDRDETGEPAGRDQGNGDSARTSTGTGGSKGASTGGQDQDRGGGNNNASAKSASTREFISYVAVRPEEDELDPDNLDHESRMKLEAKAIEHILMCEPDWQRPHKSNNPGYDLYKTNEDEQPILCEVKAMKGSLQDRPVGISRTQFDLAGLYGESYWLYVVEHAGDDQRTRIVRIQDPAGKTRTFTFDRGWIEVAEITQPS